MLRKASDPVNSRPSGPRLLVGAERSLPEFSMKDPFFTNEPPFRSPEGFLRHAPRLLTETLTKIPYTVSKRNFLRDPCGTFRCTLRGASVHDVVERNFAWPRSPARPSPTQLPAVAGRRNPEQERRTKVLSEHSQKGASTPWTNRNGKIPNRPVGWPSD